MELKVKDQGARAYLITSEPGMVEVLTKSKVQGNVLGVWSPALGEGMFLCNTKAIIADEDENDLLIILSEYVTLPNKLKEHVIYLKEISAIYLFGETH